MIFVLLACDVEKNISEDPISVEAWVEDKQVNSESDVELHVAVRYLPEYEPLILPPSSDGLEIELLEQKEPHWIGSLQQQEFHYQLSGKEGSYIINPAIVSSALLSEDLQANLIYVDIGEAQQEAQLFDAIAPPQDQNDWIWMLAGAGVVAGLVGGFLYFRRRPLVLEPHVLARQKWDSAKGLEPHPRAVQSSMIVREYLWIQHQAPLLELSAEESVVWLQKSTLPSQIQVEIQKVLTATDRLKFARQGGGELFFKELDTAFEQIVDFGVEKT
ncbi:MAG: hypothetical protein CMK59_12210 [Proteobacteria bacterium]|nr:hypothetical protein [Pseudomonadota bacterium]